MLPKGRDKAKVAKSTMLQSSGELRSCRKLSVSPRDLKNSQVAPPLSIAESDLSSLSPPRLSPSWLKINCPVSRNFAKEMLVSQECA